MKFGRKPGLYALANLRGGALAAEDVAALGLAEGEERFRLKSEAESFAARGLDAHEGAISIARDGERVWIFAGFLDEAEELAGRLGMDAGSGAAALAGAAVRRFGKQAAEEMLGEWSLLGWDGRSRELTLVASVTLRDAMFFGFKDGLLAVAPDVMTLARLGWVGLALDPVGYALNVSRAGLRHIRTEETMWRGIRLVVAGGTETFSAGGRVSGRVTPRTEFARFGGTFEEAAEALEAMGRRIVRQIMEREGTVAFQLSGGLDSTLLVSWGAYEQGVGREMFCVASVAPPGSKLPDESRFIRGAAGALGVRVTECWPRREGDLFRSPAELFAEFAAPVSGPYLTQEAMDEAAVAGGARAVVCGALGEMHVSAGFEIPETRSWLRRQVAGALERQAMRKRGGGWPEQAFAPKLTREFLAGLPKEWAKVWRKGPVWGPVVVQEGGQGGVIGISPMWYKNAEGGTASGLGLRQYLPYRDRRLMQLAAGMPVEFLLHEGKSRPFARRLLRGRVPEAIWGREQGRAYSPSYATQLKQQAGEARERLGLFREAGVGRWIDLEWLAGGLERLEHSSAERDTELFYGVQTTAQHAEFLLWLLSLGVRL